MTHTPNRGTLFGMIGICIQAGTTEDNYAHIETSTSTGTAVVSTLETPQLSLDSDGASLNFYYHMFGNTTGTLTVQTCVRTTCTSQFVRSGAQQAVQSAAWLNTLISLPANTTSVRFLASRLAGNGSWQGDISIDTITITPNFNGPPCPAPSSGAFFSIGRATPIKVCTGDNPTTPTQATCYTTNSGTCVTDDSGSSTHGNNEHCTINFLRSGFLTVAGTIRLETCCDYFTVFGTTTRRNTAALLSGVAITAGSNMTWSSDFSVTYLPWTLCVSIHACACAFVNTIPAANLVTCVLPDYH